MLAGGAGGLFAGLGLLVIPGFGPLLVVGPVAAALTGAITGGAVGGVAGSLISAGVAEASALAAESIFRPGARSLPSRTLPIVNELPKPRGIRQD